MEDGHDYVQAAGGQSQIYHSPGGTGEYVTSASSATRDTSGRPFEERLPLLIFRSTIRKLKGIFLADFGVGESARADDAFLGRTVDMDESEFRPISLAPFEVVEERPMEISFHGDAMADSCVNCLHCFFDEFFTTGVIMIRKAILGNNNWFFESIEDTAEELLKGFRLEIPTRSEEHTSELQSQSNLVCRLLLEKKNN